MVGSSITHSLSSCYSLTVQIRPHKPSDFCTAPDKGLVTLAVHAESAHIRSSLSIFLFAFVYGSFIPVRGAGHSVLGGEAILRM